MHRRDIFILAGKIYVKKKETTKQKIQNKNGNGNKVLTEILELTRFLYPFFSYTNSNHFKQ